MYRSLRRTAGLRFAFHSQVRVPPCKDITPHGRCYTLKVYKLDVEAQALLKVSVLFCYTKSLYKHAKLNMRSNTCSTHDLYWACHPNKVSNQKRLSLSKGQLIKGS